MNRLTKYSLLFWIMLLLLTSCYNKKSHEGKIFHYNEFSGIPTLDPAFAKSQATMWPAHQLFNTLVEIDDSLHIVPSLAKSWDISPDRTISILFISELTSFFIMTLHLKRGKAGR